MANKRYPAFYPLKNRLLLFEREANTNGINEVLSMKKRQKKAQNKLSFLAV